MDVSFSVVRAVAWYGGRWGGSLICGVVGEELGELQGLVCPAGHLLNVASCARRGPTMTGLRGTRLRNRPDSMADTLFPGIYTPPTPGEMKSSTGGKLHARGKRWSISWSSCGLNCVLKRSAASYPYFRTRSAPNFPRDPFERSSFPRMGIRLR